MGGDDATRYVSEMGSVETSNWFAHCQVAPILTTLTATAARSAAAARGMVRFVRSLGITRMSGPAGNTSDASLALSWSGGKDSALALWALRDEERVTPAVLLATITAEYERVSMHGVRRSLLRQQAAAVGLPLVAIEIPAECTNDMYESRMEAAFTSPDLAAVQEVAFGDLFLEDVRAYRESRLAAAGKRARFPVWGRDTATLARQFLAAGFRAILVCVDPRALDPCFAGRDYDERFLAELPAGVDPCGENGEFHTFVTDGPIFRRPIACHRGEVVERDGFLFCDLLDDR